MKVSHLITFFGEMKRWHIESALPYMLARHFAQKIKEFLKPIIFMP